MKTKDLLLLCCLSTALISTTDAPGQTFTNLYSFTALQMSSPTSFTNSDGAQPYAGLVLSGNRLYGTASGGGSANLGTTFAINADGAAFANLRNFSSGGTRPYGRLVLSGGSLYGVIYQNSLTSGTGKIFRMNTNGSGYTVLRNFTPLVNSTNSDGANPYAGLALANETLYGTTLAGGNAGGGTIFSINTNGSTFTNLHNFTVRVGATNSDGVFPHGGLAFSGDRLYGTAKEGGDWGNGTIYAMQTNGVGFTVLHHFTTSTNSTNSDGAYPQGALIESGGILYGTATDGGNFGSGTVFALNIDGTGFTNLHHFTGLSVGTNSDGAHPVAGLILSGNTLYGTTTVGGSGGAGTIFSLKKDGSIFTSLYGFTGANDGASPSSDLALSANVLYGTTVFGGSANNGTVFSLGLPEISSPQLTIISSGTNVVLTWPIEAAGFTLQSATNLVSPVSWNLVPPPPANVNGQNTVTNAISGIQQFYRLSQ
ncbi:MAG: choice-of-anchor tandem repeat GloVer-containing protein [Verrucomicrobiota bacterium]